MKLLDKWISEALDSLNEELFRHKDKVYNIGPKDESGNRPLFHKGVKVGFIRPDDSFEISEY